MKYFYELTVSSSPHVRAKESTRSLMLDVCIALLPALIGGVIVFGFRALTLTLFSVAACVMLEWGYRKLMKLDCTVGDCSAVVTGILIAFVCPVTIPYWMIFIADAFAILIVKQLFGGIGQNFVNPALAARAILLISWPVAMTTWVKPDAWVGVFSTADAVTGATPLAALHESSMEGLDLLHMFLGKTGGLQCFDRSFGAPFHDGSRRMQRPSGTFHPLPRLNDLVSNFPGCLYGTACGFNRFSGRTAYGTLVFLDFYL